MEASVSLTKSRPSRHNSQRAAHQQSHSDSNNCEGQELQRPVSSKSTLNVGATSPRFPEIPGASSSGGLGRRKPSSQLPSAIIPSSCAQHEDPLIGSQASVNKGNELRGRKYNTRLASRVEDSATLEAAPSTQTPSAADVSRLPVIDTASHSYETVRRKRRAVPSRNASLQRNPIPLAEAASEPSDHSTSKKPRRLTQQRKHCSANVASSRRSAVSNRRVAVGGTAPDDSGASSLNPGPSSLNSRSHSAFQHLSATGSVLSLNPQSSASSTFSTRSQQHLTSSSSSSSSSGSSSSRCFSPQSQYHQFSGSTSTAGIGGRHSHHHPAASHRAGSSKMNSNTSNATSAGHTQQNEPMESTSAGVGATSANNNHMETQGAATSAYVDPGSSSGGAAGGPGEDNDVNRLRELLGSRGISPQLLGTLGPRMHHFLHRYVGSMAGGSGAVSNLSSNVSHRRATALLKTLQSADENEQLGAVLEMCETLAMGNEDSLAGFPFKAVIPALVNLMTGPPAVSGSSAGCSDGLARAPNFEVMHHACRALCYMMDSLPRSTTLIAESIPRFLEKLESIHCVDVAEECLQALDMLSEKHAKTILRANGVASCLAFLDFFSTVAQRTALTITANCCAHLTPDDWPLIRSSMPLLAQRLDPGERPDRDSLDSVCLALTRIIEAFQNDPNVLSEVAPPSTLALIQALLLRQPRPVSPATFVTLIRMLALLCQDCPPTAVALLEDDIDITLRQLLVGPDAAPGNGKDSPKLLVRTPQELYEITGLIMELMPRLPEDKIFAIDSLLWRPFGQHPHQRLQHSQNNGVSAGSCGSATQIQWCWQDNNMEWQPYPIVDGRCIELAHANGEEEVSLSINGKAYTINLVRMQQVSDDSGTTRAVRRTVCTSAASGEHLGSVSQHASTATYEPANKSSLAARSGSTSGNESKGSNLTSPSAEDARAILVREKPDLVARLVRNLMNVLYEVYGSDAGSAVRQRCLRAKLRIMYYTDASTLAGVLSTDTASYHLSQSLSTHSDLRVIVMTLQLTDIIMQKMPMLFVHSLNREGVIHKIFELAARAVNQLPPPPPPISHYNSSAPLISASTSASSCGITPTLPASFVTSASLAGPPGASTLFAAAVNQPQHRYEVASDKGLSGAVPEHQQHHHGSQHSAQQNPFGQRFLGDMLKRKRTSGAASAANDKKRAAEARSGAKDSSRRPKGATIAGASAIAPTTSHESVKRGGPATRSRLSVHSGSELDGFVDLTAGGTCATAGALKPSGPEQNSSAQGSSNNSPVSLRYAASLASAVGASGAAAAFIFDPGSADGIATASPASSATVVPSGSGGSVLKKSSTTSGTPPGGSSGFFSQLVPSRLCRWTQLSSSSAHAATSSAASGSSTHQAAHSSSTGHCSSTHATAGCPPTASGANFDLKQPHASFLLQQQQRQQQVARQLQETVYKIRIWIRDQSNALISNYFSSYRQQLCRSTLERLKGAVSQVKAGREDATRLLHGLREICEILQHGDASSFELIHSGVVPALLDLFSEPGSVAFMRSAKILLHVFAGTDSQATAASLDAPEHQQQHQRLMACGVGTVPATVWDARPLLTLVSRLSSCVSQLEQFILLAHDVPGSGLGVAGGNGACAGSTRSALHYFRTHQLKCNLERHPHCTNLRQWRNGPVKIDPFALVHAIERFLIVRGYDRIRNSSGSNNDDDDCAAGSDDDNSDEYLDGSMFGSSNGSGGPHNRHRLQFLIGDTPLQYNMTVYQAVRQYSHITGFSGGAHSASLHDSDYHLLLDASLGITGSGWDSASSAIWTHIHTIYYRPAVVVDEANAGAATSSNGSLLTASSSSSHQFGRSKSAHKGKSNGSSSSKKQSSSKDELWNDGICPSPSCPIEDALTSGKLIESKLTDPSLQMLALLRVLYTLSVNWGLLYDIHHFAPAVPEEVFINAKLSNKALRQLQDPLALMTGDIPSWLRVMSAFCPFIIPFETRYSLFYSTGFDRDRALRRLVDTCPELSSGSPSERVTPRLDRKKRTVNREDLLKQAELVFNEIALSNSRALLEIQYDNEVGSGLGPTLEFYAMVSRELQRCDLDMWRNSMTSTDRALYQKANEQKFVFSPGGLYPSPLARNIKSSQLNKIKNRFKMCGKFVAKALMDSRMLDMHFSVPFFKWMLGEERTLCLRDIQYIDEHLFRNLCKLHALIEQKNIIIAQNRNLPGPALSKSLEKLTLDGCSVELLGLDFTLPGYDIELKKGGANIAVTIHNLDQYIRLVVYWTLVEGVRRQMEAFREGFESIFSICSLSQYFRPFELDRALCGDSAQWTLDVLHSACKIDHGYTLDSRAVRLLFEIMVEFDDNQRRQFLLFVTGSPRLPVGGFRALSPPLMIVKKGDSDGQSSDSYLPSVMTCVNYLKLPDYSTKKVMREKLLIAQSEGQGSFHLS